MIHRVGWTAILAALVLTAGGCGKSTPSSATSSPKGEPPGSSPTAPNTVEGRFVKFDTKTRVLTLEVGDDDRQIATTEETIAAATDTAQRMLGAPIIIVFTKSGFSARIVSAHRPQVPILALTDEPRTFSQLALVWGVIPQLVPHCATYEAMVARAREVVLTRGLAQQGDRVLVTAGVPFDVPGTTNVLRVERV